MAAATVPTAQILLAKRLAAEADHFARRADAISSGIAISMLQDSVELYVWALIKEKGLVVRDQSSFTGNLELVDKAGFAMPQVARLHELNKSRVNFKHYGNLPASGEAEKFRQYVNDCLLDACQLHFGVDYAALSLVDLIPFPDVRAKLKSCEALLANGDLSRAAEEALVARNGLFSRLDRYIPRVDSHLRDSDRALNMIDGVRGLNSFAYLTDYLNGLREFIILSVARVPLESYAHLRKALPGGTQFAAGNCRFRHGRAEYNEPDLRRAISILVDMSLRVQELAP